MRHILLTGETLDRLSTYGLFTIGDVVETEPNLFIIEIDDEVFLALHSRSIAENISIDTLVDDLLDESYAKIAD